MTCRQKAFVLVIVIMLIAITPDIVKADYTGPLRSQPATVSALLVNCSSTRDWCSGGVSVTISGSEPDPDYSIVAIEGTHNNNVFLCSGASCSVSLTEGTNTLAYWAVSSFGDTSNMSSMSVKVDATPPEVIINSPESISSVILISGIVLDEASGVDRVLVDLGKGWQPASLQSGLWEIEWDTKEEKIDDGYYQISIQALDHVGNIYETSKKVTVFNHSWPFFTLFALALSLGVSALFDPRPQAWKKLSGNVHNILKCFQGKSSREMLQ